jgi:hypothetical protein
MRQFERVRQPERRGLPFLRLIGRCPDCGLVGPDVYSMLQHNHRCPGCMRPVTELRLVPRLAPPAAPLPSEIVARRIAHG